MQIKKQKDDVEKVLFCEKHNLRLICIWEHDIRKNIDFVVELMKNAFKI
jgi:very-short-patch-repair endonuclease